MRILTLPPTPLFLPTVRLARTQETPPVKGPIDTRTYCSTTFFVQFPLGEPIKLGGVRGR